MRRVLRAVTAATLLALASLTGPPAARADGARCTFPAQPIAERPWSLQRLLLDQLWATTRGAGVRVAVIDTGVDTRNPQLADAVAAHLGADLLGGEGGATTDPVGHGTRVAGIIAARPHRDTGFVGLAPEATIIPVRQNDAEGNGNVQSLADAIDLAVARGARVINISQDSERRLTEDSDLKRAVDDARAADVVLVASVGNDGADGRRRETYPAAYEGILAVAASDRNNERAPFSQTGDFVGIAAPGVDIVSTVPGGGQCVDSGTSFAAPYVAGVAALVRAEQPQWSADQVVAHLQQTAERGVPGHDPELGWGVIDPVRALSGAAAGGEPPSAPAPDPAPPPVPAPEVPGLTLGESHAERAGRLGTFALLTVAALTAALAGATVVLRDRRRTGDSPGK